MGAFPNRARLQTSMRAGQAVSGSPIVADGWYRMPAKEKYSDRKIKGVTRKHYPT